MPERAQPRPRDAVRLVAQPVHGLRPPLHVLLRPGLRAAGRPPVRRPLRPLDPGEDERRRGARGELARRSWTNEGIAIGAATDPYQPAEGPLPAHARVPRGARRRAEPVLADHAGPLVVRDVDVLAEASRARTSRSRSRSRPSTRTSGGRPSRAPRRRGSACARCASSRGGHEGERRHGADPSRAVRPARAARRGGQGGAPGRRHRHLGEPPPPRPGTREHFLEALAATGRSRSSTTSGSTTGAPTCLRPRRSPCGALVRGSPEHGVRDRRAAPHAPPRAPEQLSLAL